MTDLKGKWGLVTGASRGLGKLAAEVLAQHGCNLILHSRSCSGTEEIADCFRKKYGIEAYSVGADLGNSQQLEKMMSDIDKNGTIPDVILNNAGVQVAFRDKIYDTPELDYRASFEINTIAPMMICYHYIPRMMEKGFGRIVNTTSGIRFEPEQGGYSASKAALDKVTIDIGSKLDGIDVMINLTDPGWCRTDLGGSAAPNSPESAVPGIVIGAFIDDKKSGRLFRSEDFHGMNLEQAVEEAMKIKSPY